MSKAIKCDRCGMYFDPCAHNMLRHREVSVDNIVRKTYIDYELCDRCYDHFQHWLKEPELWGNVQK